MKKIMLFVILVTSIVYSQDNTRKVFNDTFIPVTLSAGVSMSARQDTTSTDDTTRGFNTRGYAAIYVGIETATNDSVRLLLSYAPSKDGVNYDAYVLFDSLSSTTPVGKVKYVALPANVLGAYAVRVRLYANADVQRYGINPSSTYTAKIVRVPYNDVKLK